MSQSAPHSLPDDPAHLALFLDVDGTLLPLAATPAEVRADADTIALLARLQSTLTGALAMISGRPLEDLDRLFAPLHLAAAGQHGAEWRARTGVTSTHAAHLDELAELRAQVNRFAADDPRLLIEDKGLTLALHYRQAPERTQELTEALTAAVAGHPALTLQRGKYVLEMRPAGCGKDTAIRRMLNSAPFAGRVPIFAGDDLTDEDAFRLVNALGGVSIKVGEGASNAGYRLPDPETMRAWLGALAQAPRAEAVPG